MGIEPLTMPATTPSLWAFSVAFALLIQTVSLVPLFIMLLGESRFLTKDEKFWISVTAILESPFAFAFDVILTILMYHIRAIMAMRIILVLGVFLQIYWSSMLMDECIIDAVAPMVVQRDFLFLITLTMLFGSGFVALQFSSFLTCYLLAVVLMVPKLMWCFEVTQKISRVARRQLDGRQVGEHISLTQVVIQ